LEYDRKCFDDQGVIMKSGTCRITLFATYLILTTPLTFTVAAYSYAAETLALDQAIDMALKKVTIARVMDNRNSGHFHRGETAAGK
jgi:hypothetical protein